MSDNRHTGVDQLGRWRAQGFSAPYLQDFTVNAKKRVCYYVTHPTVASLPAKIATEVLADVHTKDFAGR